MPPSKPKRQVTWSDVKAGFADYNRAGLMDLVHALVRMFARAVTATNALSSGQRDPLLSRLDQVRQVSHNFGYGIGDDMNEIFSEHRIGKA